MAQATAKAETAELNVYTVTAANRYYYQTLRVKAESADEAERLFREYLASPEQQREEQYEYDIGIKEWEEVEEEFPDCDKPEREEYEYDFRAEDIEADAYTPHITREATTAVDMIDSGGNG